MKRTPLKRRTPLRAKRQRRARPDEPLAEGCQAGIRGVCTWIATDRHHRLRRSQGGTDDAANTLDLCRACHRWIHDHPADAYELGLLARSTDSGPTS